MPQNLTPDDLKKYVKDNIELFHANKLKKLKGLKLKALLKKKNPYLFKAKDLDVASDLVKSVLDAYLSSQEEGIFGNFLEGLAIFINCKIFGGRKSSAEGIDLEFTKENIRYIVSIKSGPNWGNSSQISKMKDYFIRSQKILKQGHKGIHVQPVNGCCYGRDNKPDKGEYYKYCGQKFWTFISDNEHLYKEIIEPLGYEAKQRNDEFMKNYAKVVNQFTSSFMESFCVNGVIQWEELVRFNSSEQPPKELERKS